MGEKARRIAAGGPEIQPKVIELSMDLRLDVTANSRLHYLVKARKVKEQKLAVSWMLARKRPPKPPIEVRLTRIAPSRIPPDDDNIVSSLKGVRDAIAQWCGIDDGDRSKLRFFYEPPVKGPWAMKAVIRGT